MSLVIGIAGGTASGKTTIATAFATEVGAALIAHDRYYRTFPDPRGVNFDHPDSLETTLLVQHLDEVRAGRPAPLPRYDFARHRREDAVDLLQPGGGPGVVVVEGILVLADPELRARFDVTVFVEAPDDIRLLRRMLRDTHERGRTVENVASQYVSSVRPMHEAWVRPSRAHARVVLDGVAPIDSQVARLKALVGGHAGAGG